MSKIVIEGGVPLSGTVAMHGAKNAVLPILAATVLAEGVHTISNCPYLSDVGTTVEILKSLGVKTQREGNTLTVDTRGALSCEIPEALMRSLRSSVIFMGAVLARCKKAVLSAPGGCELGPRPIDLHLKALTALGAKVTEAHGYLTVTADALTGKTVHLDFPSVGATENVMLAAMAAKGKTVIFNAAREPEICDLADFLNACGGRVEGAGTSTVEIYGNRPLTSTAYNVMPDRIAAATYLCAAAATGGSVTITDVEPAHLSAVLSVLSDCGCTVKSEQNSVFLSAPTTLLAPPDITTMPYPGFPTDAQSLFLAMLCAAKGTTVITETIFESRFKPVAELNRMGAKISVSGRCAVVRGVNALSGAAVCAQDLRGGAALVIAGLCAGGKTVVEFPEFIDRGYEALEARLQSLGARITRES